jgi:CO dehydrogenase nickel-insertion accessory protein CooC1
MDKTDGKVITFYSYKGGTGRSMALANIAWILASNGKKVLVIDWDLEAPGLHRYFSPFLADPELQSTTGFIDFLSEYVDASLTKPVEPKDDWYVPFTDLKGFTTSLINTNFLSNGTIDFICAGKQDAEYASKVNTFDWIVFYQKFQGGAFLNIVKNQIKKTTITS